MLTSIEIKEKIACRWCDADDALAALNVADLDFGQIEEARVLLANTLGKIYGLYLALGIDEDMLDAIAQEPYWQNRSNKMGSTTLKLTGIVARQLGEMGVNRDLSAQPCV